MSDREARPALPAAQGTHRMSGQTPEQEVDPALCKHEHTEMGYGLAGGGIGVYEYCTECYTILHKTQDQEMLEPRP
jgi:hypothetical protein